jgi:hypothetical protein
VKVRRIELNCQPSKYGDDRLGPGQRLLDT